MKLTVQTFLTLDGVMQAPGGPEEDPSEAFTHGGWQAPFPDPAVGEFVTELNSHASAFLFGRRTFDIFRGFWPDQTDPASPIATAISSLLTYPLVLGSGHRLFNDGIPPATMRPVGVTVTDLGIVIGTYEPAGAVRHGQM